MKSGVLCFQTPLLRQTPRQWNFPGRPLPHHIWSIRQSQPLGWPPGSDVDLNKRKVIRQVCTGALQLGFLARPTLKKGRALFREGQGMQFNQFARRENPGTKVEPIFQAINIFQIQAHFAPNGEGDQQPPSGVGKVEAQISVRPEWPRLGLPPAWVPISSAAESTCKHPAKSFLKKTRAKTNSRRALPSTKRAARAHSARSREADIDASSASFAGTPSIVGFRHPFTQTNWPAWANRPPIHLAGAAWGGPLNVGRVPAAACFRSSTVLNVVARLAR